MRLRFGLVCTALLVAMRVCAQSPGSLAGGEAALQATTAERIQSEAWWPTKSSAQAVAYTGSGACAKCHEEEAAGSRASSMGRAGALAADSPFLRGKATTLVTLGGLTYEVAATGAGLEYSVARDGRRVARKLDWVMGAGDLGHTFLYEENGRWYQSLTTFYLDHAQLDLTTGLAHDGGDDLAASLGVRLSAEDARKCFACHTVHATTSQGFLPQHAEAGVGCEACHGPGAAHAGDGKAAVFNPAKLSPADSIDFCGSCHRSSADVAAFTNDAISASTAVVRFQPYRLEESKCWRATGDARLTCVACHDPHQPLVRTLVAYDRNCMQCHAAGSQAVGSQAVKVCPKATTGCVQCHMPKVNVASMHGDFTDHFIRIVRTGEGFTR